MYSRQNRPSSQETRNRVDEDEIRPKYSVPSRNGDVSRAPAPLQYAVVDQGQSPNLPRNDDEVRAQSRPSPPIEVDSRGRHSSTPDEEEDGPQSEPSTATFNVRSTEVGDHEAPGN